MKKDLVFKDSYRIELFTHSQIAEDLRNYLRSKAGSCRWREDSIYGGSIFFIVGVRDMRKYLFEHFGQEDWFAMEGNVIRNIFSWKVEA